MKYHLKWCNIYLHRYKYAFKDNAINLYKPTICSKFDLKRKCIRSTILEIEREEWEAFRRL